MIVQSGVIPDAVKLCSGLKRPSGAHTKALSQLFPSCQSSSKRSKFNPFSDEVRKPGRPIKKRSKLLVAVLLKPPLLGMIPRGPVREEIKMSGGIKEITVEPSMSAHDVMSCLKSTFGVESVIFLKANKGNYLSINSEQVLGGGDIISLVATGCLYLLDNSHSVVSAGVAVPTIVILSQVQIVPQLVVFSQVLFQVNQLVTATLSMQVYQLEIFQILSQLVVLSQVLFQVDQLLILSQMDQLEVFQILSQLVVLSQVLFQVNQLVTAILSQCRCTN